MSILLLIITLKTLPLLTSSTGDYVEKLTLIENDVFLVPFGDNRILRIKYNEKISMYDLSDPVLTPKPFCYNEWSQYPLAGTPIQILAIFPMLIIILNDIAYVYGYRGGVCTKDYSLPGFFRGNIFETSNSDIKAYLYPTQPQVGDTTITFLYLYNLRSTLEKSDFTKVVGTRLFVSYIEDPPNIFKSTKPFNGIGGYDTQHTNPSGSNVVFIPFYNFIQDSS